MLLERRRYKEAFKRVPRLLLQRKNTGPEFLNYHFCVQCTQLGIARNFEARSMAADVFCAFLIHPSIHTSIYPSIHLESTFYFITGYYSPAHTELPTRRESHRSFACRYLVFHFSHETFVISHGTGKRARNHCKNLK